MDPVAAKTTTYDGPLVRERTNAAIAAQLESRGMRHVNENPDVYIVTRRSFELEYTSFEATLSRSRLVQMDMGRLTTVAALAAGTDGTAACMRSFKAH